MPDLDVQPPAFHGLAGNQYSAARWRRYLQTMIGDREGVHAYADLMVTPNTPAAMNVLVAPGRGVVNGDALARQGAYLLEQATTMTVPIAANASGNPRIDLIVLRDYDAAADGGSAGADKGVVEVVQGTPAGSPTVPSVPAGAIALAQVAVANGASSIVTANITDRRWPLGIKPVMALIQRTATQSVSSGTTLLTLPTVSFDTFGLALTANKLNLLPQVGPAALWRIDADVHLANVGIDTPWSLQIVTGGVDKIVGNTTEEAQGATSPGPKQSLSALAITTADSASRSAQLYLTHADATAVDVTAAQLAATYLGPIA